MNWPHLVLEMREILVMRRVSGRWLQNAGVSREMRGHCGRLGRVWFNLMPSCQWSSKSTRQRLCVTTIFVVYDRSTDVLALKQQFGWCKRSSYRGLITATQCWRLYQLPRSDHYSTCRMQQHDLSLVWEPPTTSLQVRRKAFGTPLSVFLSDGGTPQMSRGPGKLSPLPPSRLARLIDWLIEDANTTCRKGYKGYSLDDNDDDVGIMMVDGDDSNCEVYWLSSLLVNRPTLHATDSRLHSAYSWSVPATNYCAVSSTSSSQWRNYHQTSSSVHSLQWLTTLWHWSSSSSHQLTPHIAKVNTRTS